MEAKFVAKLGARGLHLQILPILTSCDFSAIPSYDLRGFKLATNKTEGAYHSTKNSEIFETGTNGTEISWEKFQKIRELLNFRKANYLIGKFRKFWDKNQMEQKFPGERVRKFGYTSRGCPLFRNLCKFAIFYSALAGSFGRDHSELNISRKDDGDAYS